MYKDQVTDPTGAAQFVTIYPDWYPGRTVHIHFKIRTTPTAPRGSAFTSQLYFDDALTDPRAYPGTVRQQRTTDRARNADDGIFADGGEQLMLPLTEHGEGYAAIFAIGCTRAGVNERRARFGRRSISGTKNIGLDNY